MNLGVEARKLPANIEVVLDKLRWMRQQRIWPNGLRYLWTDAFGLVLLVSLHRQLGDRSYLDEAEQRPRERKHAELGVELQLCPTAARRFNNRVDMVLVRPGGKLSA